MLTLEVRRSAHTAVIRCSGRLLQGDGAADLLRTVTAQDSREIEIDLSGVSIMDAGGLGALVAAERWAREQQRSIQLVNPSSRVRELLETTHLTAVLCVRPEPGYSAPCGAAPHAFCL